MGKFRINDNLVRVTLLALLLFILYNFILMPLGFLLPLRLSLNDALFNTSRFTRQPTKQIDEIVIVEIDEGTLLTVGKKWPWSRSFFAKIIDTLSLYKPKLIGIDITFFGESTNPDEDKDFAEAIANAGNIVLPSYISEKGDYIIPHAKFLAGTIGYGFVNKIMDHDYKVRKARVFYQNPVSRKKHYSFETVLAACYLGVSPDNIIYKDNNIIIKNDNPAQSTNNLTIPADKGGAVYINYLPIQSIQSVTLTNVMENKDGTGDLLKSKVVLLGQTSKALHDIHQTPEGFLPGIFINAFTLNTILKQKFTIDAPNYIFLPVLLILSLITAGFAYSFSMPKGLFFLLAEIILIAIISFMLSVTGIRTDYFSVLFLVCLVSAVANGYKYGNLLYSGNKLKQMVITDAVTGLATTRYFQFKLQLETSKASELKSGISIVVLSIPEFQSLQKKYRHEQVGLLLRQIGILLEKNSRSGVDTLCRWNEGRFAVILLKTNIEDASKYSLKVISKAEENDFIIGGETIRLKFFAGISNYPAIRIESAEALISYAEAAVSRGEGGQEKISIFNPQHDKIHVEILQKATYTREEDYLTSDIAEREKELLNTLSELKKSQEDIQKAHFETILSLVKALEEKDPYTAGHSERVTDYAVGIAKHLGLDENEITLIRQSALLHDIGKFGLPDSILHKKEQLTDDEFNQIKQHTINGARILEKSAFFTKHILLILHHHEKFDGKGYPHGLSGKFIPKGAQIIAIADSIDAMTSGRGYNHVLKIEETVKELKRSSGSHFDPDYIQPAIDFLLTGS